MVKFSIFWTILQTLSSSGLQSALLEARETLLQLLQFAFTVAETLHRLAIQDVGEQRNDYTLRLENITLKRSLESNRQSFVSLRDEIDRLRWMIRSEIQGETTRSSVATAPFSVTGMAAIFGRGIFQSDPFFRFDVILASALAFATVGLCIMVMFTYRFHNSQVGRDMGQVQVELCFKNSSCVMLNVTNGTRLTIS
ncbi:hypothetical protein JVU11DRAFT_8693 [Chiua virens]|nr:hypothetical protein JVU11DRAFT_8693 [Chiua virens]